MKISLVKRGVMIAVSAALACGVLYGCSSETQSGDTGVAIDTADLSGGVAATVNGVQIGENAVNSYIEEFRKTNSLEDDAAFGEYMGTNGYTPESLRQAVVDMYTNREIIRQAAAENGIEVTEADVDKALKEQKKQVGSDSKWRIMLKQSGLTEQQYREQLELSLLQNKLYYLVTGTSEFSVMAEQFFGQLEQNGGEELAELLRSGLATLESQNETDKDIVADDDVVLEFIRVYEPDYANTTSLADIPEEIVEQYRPYADSMAKQQVFNDYMEKYLEDADVQVNDMPEGAPYIVEVITIQPEDGEAGVDADADQLDASAGEGAAEPAASEGEAEAVESN